MKRYIHYGSSSFDPERFITIEGYEHIDEYSALNKPRHGVGLWGSPVDGCYISWKDWCEGEDFHTEKLNKSFEFTLKPEAKILTVESFLHIFPYLKEYKIGPYIDRCIDFKTIFDKFDGMELVLSPETYMELHDGIFYTWDCDSIVVWNKEVIVV